MFKTILRFLLCLIFLEVGLCVAKDMSLVVYQRNYFCKLVLYSAEKSTKNCKKYNKNHFIVEAENSITPLSSINTLGLSGGFAWASDAAVFTSEGVLKLREEYLKKLKDQYSNQDIKDAINLKSVVVSISGYNTNKDNSDIFKDKLTEKLSENNFTINPNNITLIDDEDFIRQVGLEAFKGSCFDKSNYNNILVSLHSDRAINYQLFKNKKKHSTDQPIISTDNLTSGYTQLGKESQKFFINLPDDYTNYDTNNKILDKVLSSQLNVDLFNKTGDNLAHWLQKDRGRDSVRGLAIIKYLLADDTEKQAEESSDYLSSQEVANLNNYLDKDLIQTLDSCIISSINNLNTFIKDDNYAIIFGEFLSNKYIRSKYLTTMNTKISEQKRRRVLILNETEFHHALIDASEKIGENNVAKEDNKNLLFYCKLYNKPSSSDLELSFKDRSMYINDFTKKVMSQPLGLLPLLWNDPSCFLIENPWCEGCPLRF